MIGLDALNVDLAVVLGKTRMSLNQLLRMSRGAMIKLDSSDSDPVVILANGHPIARGQVAVRGQAITVEVTEMVRKPEINRTPGATIGGRLKEGGALPPATVEASDLV